MKVVAACLSALVQVPLLSLFILTSTIPTPGSSNRELFMVLSPAVDPHDHFAPVVPTAIHPPRVDEADPPQIEILDRKAAQSLPPRPDAAHPNLSPPLPAEFVSIDRSRGLIVLLKIWVLVNGEVGNAKVVGSSGNAVIDDAATRFVRANWRFLPALDHGEPIATWATIEVEFSE